MLSETGELGQLDPNSVMLAAICACPGYVRGLALIGDYAVISLSRSSRDRRSADLPFVRRLGKDKKEPMCGLLVVDVRSGKLVRWLQFNHTIEQLSNVAVIQGVRQPSALGFKDPERVAGFISVDGADA